MADPIKVTLSQYHTQAYKVDQDVKMSGNEAVTIPSLPNVITPIIRFRVPRKAFWTILSRTLVIMKLRDSAGNELPRTAKIHVGFKHPTLPAPTWFTVDSYSPWALVSLANQKNIQYQNDLRLSIPKSYTLDEDYEIWFGISQTSGTNFVLSWADSDFEFDIYETAK